MQQSLRQEQVLLPAMLQSMELLQLPSVELGAFLERAAEENLALFVEPPAPFGASDPDASARRDAWLQNQPDREPGLTEDLEGQLPWLDLSNEVDPWVRHVIASLEASGRLASSDESLLGEARRAGLAGDAGDLGRAIAIVQALEPRGIGGRDVVETLLLQLDPTAADYPLLARLVEEHLDDLARNKRPRIAEALEIDLARLDELVRRLAALELTPGAMHTGGDEPTLVPDIHVEQGDDGFVVRLEEGGLHAVAVDADVETLAREKALDREVKALLRQQVEQARWIVEAVEQRRRTLLRVARATFARQRAFLEHGRDALSALRMTELGEELELHVSTISRAVAGKYVATPHGLVALRWFFQAPGGGSEDLARASVVSAVRTLVEHEDAARPLSDEELVERLAGEGFKLARRTVAKYRKELGIPSSYRRRRYS
ncbi:MAG: RNA polymerase factor sigma-54 [Planctomycetota bacterium]